MPEVGVHNSTSPYDFLSIPHGADDEMTLDIFSAQSYSSTHARAGDETGTNLLSYKKNIRAVDMAKDLGINVCVASCCSCDMPKREEGEIGASQA